MGGTYSVKESGDDKRAKTKARPSRAAKGNQNTGQLLQLPTGSDHVTVQPKQVHLLFVFSKDASREKTGEVRVMARTAFEESGCSRCPMSE